MFAAGDGRVQRAVGACTPAQARSVHAFHRLGVPAQRLSELSSRNNLPRGKTTFFAAAFFARGSKSTDRMAITAVLDARSAILSQTRRAM